METYPSADVTNMLAVFLELGGYAVRIRRIVAIVAAACALTLLGSGVASAATAIEYGLVASSVATGP
jgi:hypothetical protein